MKIWSCILLAFLVFAFPAHADDAKTIPVLINGDVVEIGLDSDMKTVAKDLSMILSPEFLSVSTSERIQYDFFPMKENPPVTVLFDFDKDGMFLRAIMDANDKESNPVAQDLVTWLELNVGKGEKINDATVWHHAGLSLTLSEMVDAGEDSAYRMTIER